MASRATILLAALCLLSSAQPRRPQEFVIYALNGSRINVTQYTGKVVVLEFLLTTCQHCQRLTAVLKKLQAEFGPDRLQVLGCTVEEMAPAKIPAFVAQFSPGFPVGFAEPAPASAYLEHDPKTLLKMPQLVFLDTTGEKRAKYIGDQPFFGKDEETNIRREIALLLDQSRTTPGKR